MSEPELSTVFPEINDPEWLKEREECWALALEKGDWKSEYRKKDLEKIRQYFFYGKYPEGLDITKYSGVMLDLFPIQTKAGYDYYYKTHEFTPEQLESNFRSAFLDQQTSGMRWQEQREYFDYHVGDKFLEKKIFIVKGNPISISVEIRSRFKDMSSRLYSFLGNEPHYLPEKIYSFLPYYKSMYEYLFSHSINLDEVGSKTLPKLMRKVSEDDYDHDFKIYSDSRRYLCEELNLMFQD